MSSYGSKPQQGSHRGSYAGDLTESPHQQPFAPATVFTPCAKAEVTSACDSGGTHLLLSTPAFCSPPQVIQATGRWLSHGKTKPSKIPSQHIKKQRAGFQAKTTPEKKYWKRKSQTWVICFSLGVLFWMLGHVFTFSSATRRAQKKEVNVRI